MVDSSDYEVMDVYFRGDKLYGNDFSQDQINSWFAEETEGYFNLSQSNKGEYSYGYHVLNLQHGYSQLPKQRFSQVLGVGSAYGDELEPIIQQSDKISILEPSDGFQNAKLKGVPINYVKPIATGDIPFESKSLDLITCFGVLHHIPNVEKVVTEFYRVLKPGGYVLIREPIISMGDWRKPRVGLTKNERGIPLDILREFVNHSGFKILREDKCIFSLTSRLRSFVFGSVFNNRFIVYLDALLCSIPIWSRVYHAHNIFQKIRPTSVFYVLHKPPIEKDN